MKTNSKSVCFDLFNHIVKNHNNTHHNTIKIKPIDVKSNSYAEFNVGSNEKDPKFKIGDRVRISKYKNIFDGRYVPNWSEEVFVISKIKNTVPWTFTFLSFSKVPRTFDFFHLINHLTVKKLFELFIKKNCRRLIKQDLE